MQKIIITVAVLALVSIQADADDFTDTARVISSTPIYQTVTGQECYNIPVSAPATNNRSMGGSILGGIAGALLGSQVGQGNGRVAAGAVGAIAGAIAGDRVQNSESSGNNADGTERQCKDITKQVVAGYKVSYEYGGHVGVTTMPQQPGNTITVGVTALN